MESQDPKVKEEQSQAETTANDGVTDQVATLRETYSLPESWTIEQIKAWSETVSPGSDEKVSENGVFFVDPTRASRSFDSWSTEELRMALQGKLKDFSDKLASKVVAEYAKREVLESAWNTQQVLEYFRQGIEPKKTSNGVWVLDVTRAQRDASAWSTAELEAWALGEIRALGKANDAKCAIELKNRLHLPAKDNSAASVIAAYRKATGADSAKSQITVAPETPAPSVLTTDVQTAALQSIPVVQGLSAMNVSFIDSALDRYFQAVKPNQHVSDAVGANAQKSLDQLLTYVVGLEPQAMVAGLQRIKEYVKAHRTDVFSASMAYRFTSMILLNQPKLQERHKNFIELMRVFSDDNRDVRKQVDLRFMLQGWPQDKVDMLHEYFTKVA